MIICGSKDVPLTPHGIIQMEALGERLSSVNIDLIYSSDLQRTRIGAGIVAKNHNAPLFQIPKIRELNFGVWEGLSFQEIERQFPGETKKRFSDLLNYQIPEGETILDFAKRIIKAFDLIIHKNRGKDILIVAHGGVNRIILCHVLDIDFSKMFNFEQDYGCLNIIDFFPDNIKVLKLVNG